jgi:hypothetical protein
MGAGQEAAMTQSPLALLSLVLLTIPISSFHVDQLQALNRELGKLCSSPPPQAMTVCRIHARLVSSL